MKVILNWGFALAACRCAVYEARPFFCDPWYFTIWNRYNGMPKNLGFLHNNGMLVNAGELSKTRMKNPWRKKQCLFLLSLSLFCSVFFRTEDDTEDLCIMCSDLDLGLFFFEKSCTMWFFWSSWISSTWPFKFKFKTKHSKTHGINIRFWKIAPHQRRKHNIVSVLGVRKE